MIIFPAIDISGGNVVRLYKGDYNKMTVYKGEPCEVAKEYESVGATHLHVVDLDGAKSGSTENFASIEKIIKERTGKNAIGFGSSIKSEKEINNMFISISTFKFKMSKAIFVNFYIVYPID